MSDLLEASFHRSMIAAWRKAIGREQGAFIFLFLTFWSQLLFLFTIRNAAGSYL